MKREFLKNLKSGEAPLPDEVIEAIMAENGRDIEAVKAKFSDYEDLKARLAEAGKTIEGFKALDVDGVKKAAEEWKRRAEQAEKEAEEKIAAMRFDTMLDAVITAARGKNTKAVRAMLDLGALRASKNQEQDAQKAVDALKSEHGWAFESQTPPPYAAGTGTAPVGERRTPQEAAIRAAAGLKN